MKRFFYLIVLWSIPFVVNAEAQCYPNPDFSGTALSHCPSGDCTGAAPYKFVGENWSLRLDQVSGECLNSAHNGYWGDPDTYQAATIDANLSFDLEASRSIPELDEGGRKPSGGLKTF
jgi:hypothetical protein